MSQSALFTIASDVPASVAACLWRGNEMGGRSTSVVASGFRLLDRELPGGGWPGRSLTELLSEPAAHCEWRLLAPALQRIQKRGGTVFLIGTPQTPHLPGLRLMGIDERRLVWVPAVQARDRLWATQQVIQSGQAGAILAWLPQADARAMRRLQACTQACDAPVFVMRPAALRHETSPAPLRVEVALDKAAWNLRLHVFKRRGPPSERAIDLPSVPGGLTQVLARRAASLTTHRVPVLAPAPVAPPSSSPVPIQLPLLPLQKISPEPIDEPLAGTVLPTPLRVAAG